MRRSLYSIVGRRLSSRLHRVFAKAIRKEADARRIRFSIGPFDSSIKAAKFKGWDEVAIWLEQRADGLETQANKAREPRF